MKLKAPPVRFYIAILVFLTTFTNYMNRSNYSVSVLSMRYPPVTAKKNATAACPKIMKSKRPLENTGIRYKWTKKQDDQIMAAYFYGYTLTCLTAGTLSELIGPWHVILWSSVATAILCALTPISATAGWGGVFAVRFLIGAMGGYPYPAVSFLIAKWAPPKEKSRFIAAMMGNSIGTIASWPVIGGVTSWTKDWAWGFYAVTIIQSAFCIIFAVVGSSTPEKHWFIKQAEIDYIRESHAGTVAKKKHRAPFLKILTSIPCWALFLCQFGNLWGLNLILTYAPKYLNEVLGFNLKDSSGIASIPYVARLFCGFGFGFLADWLRSSGKMRVNRIRKMFVGFSHLIPAATFLLIYPMKCEYIGIIVLLVLNQGLNGAVTGGHVQNSQDLAPNFAGTLYASMNFVGTMTGFIIQPVGGAIEKAYANNPILGGAIIFIVGGVVMATGGIIFILFGSAQLQEFNKVNEEGEAGAAEPPK